MKNIILVLCLFAAFGLQAQQDIYSRAKVKLSPEKSAFQLARLGFDISHGQYAPAKHFISEFSQEELELIRSAGFETVVLIADLKAHFLTQQSDDTAQLRDEDCFDDSPSPYDQYVTPENYTDGSMGGYLTYAEMLDVLDDMAAQYPNLISARTPLSTQTIEGNDIFWIRLSDNPTTDEDTEPEVLYTALHHAREPNSMSQMIYFLWYMLENYDTDPEVQYLVDNVEMYFVPCVNVDGYLYNEQTDPDGGGFWRKNRRVNEDGTFGVDLNRNYGYEWGINDTGSSPNPDGQTYRGTAPFSEPEAQAIKDFCEEHEFQIAHNYHAYGNLLIHPWGYDDSP
ncbi:MAG: carboxypeptidase T, partial [Saprospiraceae bacterium]